MNASRLDADGIPRSRHAEIEINTSCDCLCPCCDRFVDVAPTSDMTLEQVKHFVRESLELDWEWGRIHVLGGEPTLHPEFLAILEELLRYRERHPSLLLRVISNGSGKLARYRQWLQEHGIVLNVESKAGGRRLPPWFCNMWLAPQDQPGAVPGEPVEPCAIFGIEGCGLGITKHGIFLCGAGAAIARVVGLDIGVQHLSQVTYALMLDQARELCHLCGHTLGIPATEGLRRSPFWEAAIANYQAAPPRMSLYGG